MKALVMFSWWLDSILAVKILEKQWIDCTAIIFTSPFFSDKKAKIQAEKFDIKLMSVDITDPHFQMLQNPLYWYGKNLNPCIDCHGLMFKIAWEIADQEWFQIIASWEGCGTKTYEPK
jgi:tRNA-specific 2-thiouridylase